MSNNELRPCPFCGGKARLRADDDSGGWGRSYYAECSKCRVKVRPEEFKDYRTSCGPDGWKPSIEHVESKVAQCWNTRRVRPAKKRVRLSPPGSYAPIAKEPLPRLEMEAPDGGRTVLSVTKPAQFFHPLPRSARGEAT